MQKSSSQRSACLVKNKFSDQSFIQIIWVFNSCHTTLRFGGDPTELLTGTASQLQPQKSFKDFSACHRRQNLQLPRYADRCRSLT